MRKFPDWRIIIESFEFAVVRYGEELRQTILRDQLCDENFPHVDELIITGRSLPVLIKNQIIDQLQILKKSFDKFFGVENRSLDTKSFSCKFIIN